MKITHYLIAIPVFIIMSCGAETEDDGSDSTTDNTENAENTEENDATAFSTSFGECNGENKMSASAEIESDTYSFSMGNLIGLDLSTFSHVSAELTENKQTLRIKFVNNAAIMDKGITQFGERDMSMTISANNSTSELNAGAYSGDDLKLSLTKGFMNAGVSSTKAIGSNKITSTIEINDLTDEQVCGSFQMTGEDGIILFTANFDTKVKSVKW